MTDKQKPANDTEILVVEDSPTQAEALRYVLEQQGYSVNLAASGEQSLTLSGAHKPGLIISDINMPEMNGYELCQRLKADENTWDIPVILLTALSNPADVIEGLACSADSFITKPYNEEYLLKHVDRTLTEMAARPGGRGSVEVEIGLTGKSQVITVDPQRMVGLLLSTYEAAIYRNAELIQTQDELSALNDELEELVEERTAALSAEIAGHKQAQKDIESLSRFPAENSNPVLRLSQAGLILYANAASKPLLQQWGCTVGDHAPAEWRNHIIDAFTHQTNLTLDAVFNGRVYSILITPVSEAGYANLYGTDITERKQAEEALRQSEANYRTLMEQASDGIFIADANGNYTDVNSAGCTLLGYSREEILNLSLKDVLLPDDLMITPVRMPELQAGQTILSERRMRRKDGSVFPAEISGKRLADGRLQGLVRDITQRKQAEAAIHQLNTELEQRVADRTAELRAANLRLTELDHLKDEFMSRTSHELRTPLTSIKIYLELLETAKPEKRDKYMKTLNRETDRLYTLIEGILAFSELNLKIDLTTLSPIDLNNLIAGRLTTWQTLSAGHDLLFQLDLARDLPHVRADGELFMQALNRLITNAVSYTSTGSVVVSTARVDEDDRQWVTVSVKDAGPGITPDELPHIFERFYRGRAAADYKTPGTGVGLSISREIVEKLGGRLTVETKMGAGSTFTLWLPVGSEIGDNGVATGRHHFEK